jgi:hypothetical protein
MPRIHVRCSHCGQVWRATYLDNEFIAFDDAPLYQHPGCGGLGREVLSGWSELRIAAAIVLVVIVVGCLEGILR